MTSLSKKLTSNWKTLLLITLALLGDSLMLAWISSGFDGFHGWLSFLTAHILAAGLLLAAWWLLRDEKPPRWLGLLLVGAVALRLAAGMIWFVAAPVWGHGSPAEKGGYIMADASQRDQAAWKLASSHKPLWAAFYNFRSADQYGGLLFLSALVYRGIGGPLHQPLLIVVFTAAFSSLAVLFTWAFARRAWDEKIAWLAAWIIAFYPEAILMGSTQMREAFTITLTVMAFYGLLRYQHERISKGIVTPGLAWIFIPLLLYLPFSPPFTALLIGMLALAALVAPTPKGDPFPVSHPPSTSTEPPLKAINRSPWFWLVLGVVVILVLISLWLTLSQLAPASKSNPVSVVIWWARRSAELQAYASKHASGWMQKIFKLTPAWTHLPMLLAYGVTQPFLPAAIVVSSQAPIWPWIALWRSLGWTILLALLLYAPLLAISQRRAGALARVLSLIAWAGILIASFRGGADMWDNPRYRATFAGLQAALVAWAWVEHRRVADPWLRRALVSLAATVIWFVPWYVGRYTAFDWIVDDPFKTLALGLASALLFSLWDWAGHSSPISQSKE